MAVPLLDLKAQYRALRDDIQSAVREVMDAQSFILGSTVEGFEREVAEFLGVRHALGCASGTDALILSLAALDVGAGSDVITTPFSFFATASCAVRVGARPVFADIDPETFNIAPEGIGRAITPRTRAIVPVHLFGQCAPMAEILELAGLHRIPVVEDACQSLSAVCRRATGEWVASGAMGSFGAYSFFPSKNLGGAGDGGLVVTGDAELAARVRSLRVHGERERYHHRWVGWNSRLDALQAAVLRVKLPHLAEWSLRRRENADRYDRLLTEAGLVADEAVTLPARVPGSSHIFNQYTLRVRNRDGLVDHLREAAIGHAVYYPVPLHLQECFRDLGYRAGDFPNAERAAREVISLPVYPELTSEQQDEVVEALAAFYRA